MRSRFGWALVLVLLSGSPAAAQSGITDWTARAYQSGSSTPVAALPIPVTAAICDQAPDPQPPPVAPLNPSHVEWDDPDRPGRMCSYHDPQGNVPLFSGLAPGLYDFTLTASNIGGEGAESARVPFRAGLPPPAPTGVGLRP
jgi:hypothetical protein